MYLHWGDPITSSACLKLCEYEQKTPCNLKFDLTEKEDTTLCY